MSEIWVSHGDEDVFGVVMLCGLDLHASPHVKTQKTNIKD